MEVSGTKNSLLGYDSCWLVDLSWYDHLLAGLLMVEDGLLANDLFG